MVTIQPIAKEIVTGLQRFETRVAEGVKSRRLLPERLQGHEPQPRSLRRGPEPRTAAAQADHPGRRLRPDRPHGRRGRVHGQRGPRGLPHPDPHARKEHEGLRPHEGRRGRLRAGGQDAPEDGVLLQRNPRRDPLPGAVRADRQREGLEVARLRPRRRHARRRDGFRGPALRQRAAVRLGGHRRRGRALHDRARQGASGQLPAGLELQGLRGRRAAAGAGLRVRQEPADLGRPPDRHVRVDARVAARGPAGRAEVPRLHDRREGPRVPRVLRQRAVPALQADGTQGQARRAPSRACAPRARRPSTTPSSTASTSSPA